MPNNYKWFTVKNAATTEATDIMIYDKIGKTWVGDDGIAAKDFAAALKDIPVNNEILVHINSRGGNVWDGVAIYGMLQGRKNKVTCQVEGVAASIAAIIACAGKKTVFLNGALGMIHPPSALPQDSMNASDCRDLADKLDVHAQSIASILAEKTGKTQAQCLAKMNEGETWMSADDAVAFGLCNEISGVTATAFLNEAKAFDFSNFGKTPDKLKNIPVVSDDKTKNTTMKKEQVIAFLKENGFVVADDASDEVINATLKLVSAKLKVPPAAPPPPEAVDNAALKSQLDLITAQMTEQKKMRIENAVADLVTNCQVSAEEAPKAVLRAVADETYLAELQARPQVLPGAPGLIGSPAVITKDVSIRNALKELNLGVCNKSGEHAFGTAVDRSQKVSLVYAESRDKILPVLNAAAVNTIDVGLKRVLIMQETVRDFATRVLPARLFATIFGNVPLQGTDTVVVPYYPLQAAASLDFVDGDGTGGTGYQFGQGTNTNSKTITVNKRKFQPLDYSSNTFRRQPYFDSVRLGKINAEKLGVDILLDLLTVFTPANFPTIAQADPAFNPNLNMAAGGYDSNQIKDLETVATNLNWPDGGRALIVGTTLDNVLAKDPTYKLALNIGTTSVIQDAQFPKLSGFDYAKMPAFPANGCNLQGIIAFASALASAFAPIDPAAGVRQQLVSYDIATDLTTGISFNHRHWGLAQADRDFEVIESAYGYAPILARAAQLLTHP